MPEAGGPNSSFSSGSSPVGRPGDSTQAFSDLSASGRGASYAVQLDVVLKEVANFTHTRAVQGAEATELARDHWTERQPLYLNHTRELIEGLERAGFTVKETFFVPLAQQSNEPVILLEVRDVKGRFLLPGIGFVEGTAQLDDLRGREPDKASSQKQVQAGLEFEFESLKLGFPVQAFASNEPVWLLLKPKDNPDRSFATEAMYTQPAYARALAGVAEASQTGHKDLAYNHLFHEVAATQIREAVIESDIGAMMGSKEMLEVRPGSKLKGEVLHCRIEVPGLVSTMEARFEVHLGLVRGRAQAFASLEEHKSAEFT